jgi:predicted RNA methylase
MVNLGQHYTAKIVSEAIIDTLSIQSPKLILDIGAGRGSLSLAASSKFRDAQLITVEVSDRNHRHLKKIFPDAEHVKANAFEFDLPSRFGHSLGEADIGICNPPFIQLDGSTSQELLDAAGMPSNWHQHITQRAEIAFAAQNLRMLKREGELAIILPEIYANGHQFEPFRRWLLRYHEVLSVIRLPSSSFTSAEVNTFSITLRKNGYTKAFQAFEIINGKAVGTARLTHAQAIQRLLPNPVLNASPFLCAGSLKLVDINAQVCRGTTVNELEALRTPYFHTTDFKCYGSKLNFGKLVNLPQNVRVAIRGDVLLGRIGRSCHLQAAVVAGGNIPISDCVYRVRVPTALQAWAIKSLLSAEGAAWRESRLHGSAVSLLSKLDLMQHPVFIGS